MVWDRQHLRRVRVAVSCGMAILVLSLHWTGGQSAYAKPQRIVSINVCTDQLVLLLADRDYILSVSHLAADPHVSAMAGEVAGLRFNHGLAEEILPMDPDLVLASAFTARPTVFLLRRLGFTVVQVPVASSLQDVRSNVRKVAAAVGEPQRGEDLIAAFDDSLPSTDRISEPRPLAALYWANGYTSGQDTLANDAVEAAGFRTLGRELGLFGTSQLPLETLLAANVEVLILGEKRDGAALAQETLRHPALMRAFATRPVIFVPDSLWACGTPFVAEQIARLAAFRARHRGEASDK